MVFVLVLAATFGFGGGMFLLDNKLRAAAVQIAGHEERLERFERRVGRVAEKLTASNRSIRALIDEYSESQRAAAKKETKQARQFGHSNEQIRTMLEQLKQLQESVGGSLAQTNSSTGHQDLASLAESVRTDVASGMKALRMANKAVAEAAKLKEKLHKDSGAPSASGTSSNGDGDEGVVASGSSGKAAKPGEKPSSKVSSEVKGQGEAKDTGGEADGDSESEDGSSEKARGKGKGKAKGGGKKGRRGKG